jgi:hypothetical protein
MESENQKITVYEYLDRLGYCLTFGLSPTADILVFGVRLLVMKVLYLKKYIN